ncbi:putative disease resistance protein RGA4 [Ziziphus jujuba]|uniref:Disease resistance protein RGA4 n=1 Tax=Ziziphus jujuba TaxID=326968 RepID=A0A6P4A6X7_ZIZJJ|nr:putative disease resistance protein RGA4 [Ziziphus jujuba]
MDLSDDPGDVSVFPIVGMGGLGKTTLAKLVYNDKSVEEHFERRIWVCVSEEFDVKKIMKAVVESATGNRCDLLEMETIHRRVQELMTRKRFLLVLDDVWNEDHEKWDRLKNSMRHGSVGSKVLVTTRSEKVALIMGTVSPYHLKGLSDENCWLLFQKRAFKNGKPEETSNLIAIGKEIARKCKGVPLAAKALGSSLALKRKDDWLNVRNSEMWKFMGEEVGILPVLRLSYRNLPSHLKQCFAYCSLFPKDYKIKKENLIHLWMAEGFIQPTRGKQLEAVANECFDELLCRSFFQNAAKDSNGDIVECEMHHLLHDLAKSVAGNACLMLDVCQQPIIPSDTRHLSVLCNETKKMKFIRDNLKLRSLLLLFGQQKIAKVPHNLIMRMKCLRALDISSTRIKKLSKSVGALKHLRYLNLSHSHIKKLPDTICSLYNLETLLLLQCIRLEKLPDDLRKLINLRHLNIYGCGLLSKLPNGIGELTSLKTLPTFIVGREIGCGISELKSLDLHGELKITNLENVRNGVGSVKDANLKDKRHIHSLKFIWEDVADVSLRENVDGVIEALQPSSELKKLTIENYMGSKFPSWLMNHYLTNLVELSLIKCCRCVQLPSLGKLPLLEFLTIDEMDATMYFCSDSKENTGVADDVSLKRLSLKSMPNLLGWSSAEGRVILSCLKELKVEDAPEFINLPNLPSMECLELIYCREDILMNVTEMTSPSNITLGGFEELVDLPQGLLSNKTGLLSFEIKDCPKLVNFSGELNSLSLLQSLSISNCPNIKCLSELGVLKALKSLAIDRCHGLLSLPEEEIQGLTSLQHFSLSNCENITALPYTMQQFTNLQTLHIWSCPKVDSLPEWLGNLVSLRELELWYCENLLYLPESMQGLTALQFLSIWGCPQLEIHLEKDKGPDWYKIQHIPFIKVNGPYIQAIV